MTRKYEHKFASDKVRVSAFVESDQRVALKKQALDRGMTLQQYIFVVLTHVAKTGTYSP